MKKLSMILKEIIKTEVAILLEFMFIPIQTVWAFLKYQKRFENKYQVKNFLKMNFFDWICCPVGIVVMPYRIVKRNLK